MIGLGLGACLVRAKQFLISLESALRESQRQMRLCLLVCNGRVARMGVRERLEHLAGQCSDADGLLESLQSSHAPERRRGGFVKVTSGEEVSDRLDAIAKILGFVLHAPHPITSGRVASPRASGRVGDSRQSLRGPAVYPC